MHAAKTLDTLTTVSDDTLTRACKGQSGQLEVQGRSDPPVFGPGDTSSEPLLAYSCTDGIGEELIPLTEKKSYRAAHSGCPFFFSYRVNAT